MPFEEESDSEGLDCYELMVPYKKRTSRRFGPTNAELIINKYKKKEDVKFKIFSLDAYYFINEELPSILRSLLDKIKMEDKNG